jgi:polyhydroxyalkanoate synthesis regulator phasin
MFEEMSTAEIIEMLYERIQSLERRVSELENDLGVEK